MRAGFECYEHRNHLSWRICHNRCGSYVIRKQTPGATCRTRVLYFFDMANFSTHVTGATAASCLMSTVCLKAGFINTPDAFLLTFAGVTGGILPDIDLKHSHPSKIVFTTLGLLVSMLWVFVTNAALSVLEMWFFGVCLFLVIRYPVWATFHRFTVHRGSLHSVAAACMFAMVAILLSSRAFGLRDELAWLVGVFIFAGCIFHLALDEIYSVDFLGHRIKRSFGSALKIIDLERLIPSAAIIFVAVMAWLYTPPSNGLLQNLTDTSFRQQLQENFLPDAIPDYLQGLANAISDQKE